MIPVSGDDFIRKPETCSSGRAGVMTRSRRGGIFPHRAKLFKQIEKERLGKIFFPAAAEEDPVFPILRDDRGHEMKFPRGHVDGEQRSPPVVEFEGIVSRQEVERNFEAPQIAFGFMGDRTGDVAVLLIDRFGVKNETVSVIENINLPRGVVAVECGIRLPSWLNGRNKVIFPGAAAVKFLSGASSYLHFSFRNGSKIILKTKNYKAISSKPRRNFSGTDIISL